MIVCCDKPNLAIARVSALTARERCLSCLAMGPEMEVASLPPGTHLVGSFSVDDLLVRSRDGWHITLVEAFTFWRPCGEPVTVEEGAEADGASSPRPLWAIISPFGDHWMAAVVHDAMYRMKTRPRVGDREVADTIFLEAMEALGVARVKRLAMYETVRLKGQNAWFQGHGVPV